jgi:hypothetical protein
VGPFSCDVLSAQLANTSTLPSALSAMGSPSAYCPVPVWMVLGKSRASRRQPELDVVLRYT